MRKADAWRVVCSLCASPAMNSDHYAVCRAAHRPVRDGPRSRRGTTDGAPERRAPTGAPAVPDKRNDRPKWKPGDKLLDPRAKCFCCGGAHLMTYLDADTGKSLWSCDHDMSTKPGIAAARSYHAGRVSAGEAGSARTTFHQHILDGLDRVSSNDEFRQLRNKCLEKAGLARGPKGGRRKAGPKAARAAAADASDDNDDDSSSESDHASD